MRISWFGHALIISGATALLANCGGGSQPPVTMHAAIVAPDSLPYHHTFNYTGHAQFFQVSQGVRFITAVVRGAGGGGALGGRGGRVFAEFPVVPGEHLAVFVGGTANGAIGGFNGGGSAPFYSYTNGYGGGGASDIREGGDRLRDRIVIAGGGGGYAAQFNQYSYGAGGEGGGSTAGNGNSGRQTNYSSDSNAGGGGGGGTQYGGGSGGAGGIGYYEPGYPGTPGVRGKGGSGGEGGGGTGGGGGGGYYGGGGGGAGAWDYGDETGGGGGGGGGSSFIEPRARKFVEWKGWKNATGNGLVVFSWK